MRHQWDCGCGETSAFLVPSVSTACHSKPRDVASYPGVTPLKEALDLFMRSNSTSLLCYSCNCREELKNLSSPVTAFHTGKDTETLPVYYIAGRKTEISRDLGASDGFNLHSLTAGPTLSRLWRVRKDRGPVRNVLLLHREWAFAYPPMCSLIVGQFPFTVVILTEGPCRINMFSLLGFQPWLCTRTHWRCTLSSCLIRVFLAVNIPKICTLTYLPLRLL